MPMLDLDFVKSPAPPLLGVMLLVAGAALAGWCSWEYAKAGELVASASDNLARWHARHQKIQAAAPRISSEAMEAEQRREKEIRAALAFPWPSLFRQLEAAAIDDVAILAIQPDARKRQLRINAEAKDYDAVTAYIAMLGSQPRLQNVHLLKHQVEVDAKQQPVAFSIGADWGWQP